MKITPEQAAESFEKVRQCSQFWALTKSADSNPKMKVIFRKNNLTSDFWKHE